MNKSLLSKSAGLEKAGKGKKKLSDIHITWISLVGLPANEKSIVYKSGEEPPEEKKKLMIIKTDEVKHLIYATVYEPDTEDSQGESTTAEEIEKACHRFLYEYRQDMVDTEHDTYQNGTTIVENFIKKGEHPEFPETKNGAWCIVLKVSDIKIWEKVQSGEITGVSMFGDAVKTPVSKSEHKEDKAGMMQMIEKIYHKVFKTDNNLSEEQKMEKETKERFEKLEKKQGDLEASNEELKKSNDELKAANEELKKSNEDLAEKNKKLSEDLEEVKKGASGRITKKATGGEGKETEDEDGEPESVFG